jgi:hypothetical protein
MADQPKSNSDPFAGLKSWVGIVVLLVGFAVQWGVFTQQIVQLRYEQVAMEQRLIKANEEQNAHFTAVDAQIATRVGLSEQNMIDIKVQLAGIQKDLVYIRQSLDQHMNQTGK